MAPKAPRIPASTWEKYKDEITTLYTRPEPEGTLAKTMKFMKETHGFEATKNQYTAKLKSWGLQKYVNHHIWAYVDQIIRKRKEEGKDSETIIRGIKKLRTSVEKEIARSITRMDRLQRQKTPEGVEVVTPSGEVICSNSVAVREVHIQNLPWFQLLEDMQRVIFQVMDNSIPGYSGVSSALEQPNDLLSLLDGTQFTANLLQMALGSQRLQLISSESTSSDRHSGQKEPTPVLVATGRLHPYRKCLTSYLPSSGISDVMPSLSAIRSLGIPPQFAALLSFMQSFIYLTNNTILEADDLFKAISWLLGSIDPRLFSYIFSLHTTSIRIFMVKILPAVMKYGNINTAQDVINWTINNACRPSDSCMMDCMRAAAMNGDTRMVELLCRAKFSLCIGLEYSGEADAGWLPWNKGNVEVLKILLSFQADPDRLCEGEGERGLALIGAARSGNLEAVDILLKAGCHVNLSVEDFYGTALQAAVFGEHSTIVEILIRHGADVNAACATNSSLERKAYQTPLQTASENGNTSIFDILLAHGASAELDPMDTFGRNTPNALQFCVRDRNISFVRKLLDYGCNPNTTAFPDVIDAPLQIAARRNYPEIAEILIEYGADVNISPSRRDGRTAIQAAAESGSIQIIEMLVTNGANINAPPCHELGLTALQAAIKNGHCSIAKRLLMLGAEINAAPCHVEGVTAIQAAACTGDLNMIQYLLDLGADVNGHEADIRGISVLAAAMSHRDLPMLKVLVEHGAKICGLKKHNSKPPIVAAAENGWVDGVRYLLANGASVDSYAEYRHFGGNYICALGCAIDNQRVEMVKLLLESGADLHLPSTEKLKVHALCYALELEQSHPEEMIQLILHYVTPAHNIFDEDVLASAVYATITTDDTTVLSLILKGISQLPRTQKETQINKAWQKHLEHIHWLRDEYYDELAIKATKILLRAGADVNSRVEINIQVYYDDVIDETTLLREAVSRNRVTLAKWLIEEGAEIQVPASEWTGTPLQEAIKNENFELVKILLEQNPDVNSPPAPDSGMTALQAAASTGAMEIAIELLKRGAYVAAPAADECGTTALNVAASKGREDMLQLLLNHYDGCEDLDEVCEEAADYADEEGHLVIGQWLREYCKVQST